MPDISMCLNDKCTKHKECYRYMAVPKRRWQSYAAFKLNEDGTCNHFIKLEEGDICQIKKMKNVKK